MKNFEHVSAGFLIPKGMRFHGFRVPYSIVSYCGKYIGSCFLTEHTFILNVALVNFGHFLQVF